MKIFTTVGVHPTRCLEFTKDGSDHKSYLEKMRILIKENKNLIGAIGECGVDKDRLHFCPLEEQMSGFEQQISLATEFNLPLFLHSRNCTSEFMSCFENNTNIKKLTGCVHSFTDSLEDLNTILNKTNFYIGINGCSLKNEENLEVENGY